MPTYDISPQCYPKGQTQTVRSRCVKSYQKARMAGKITLIGAVLADSD
jgi:hypothetical protein